MDTNMHQSEDNKFIPMTSILSGKADFIKEMDDFVAVMNLKGLVALELDAGWKNKTRATNDNISKTFKDFNGENKAQ